MQPPSPSSNRSQKCVSLDTMAELTATYRQDGKIIVHCHGVFDLLHIGHIRYFEQARLLGDILIVTLTTDKHVDKGPHRPAFPEDLRAEAIASLAVVDHVAINQGPTAVETLRLLRPHFYVKGAEFRHASSDRTGKIDLEKKVVEEIGASFSYIDDVVFSSSNLINRYLSTFSEEVESYLTLFRNRYSLTDILDIFDRMAKLNVLVIGDTILDEYQYCNAIGKSSKDPTLVVQYQSEEIFAGGILAVANHVANFAESVDLITVLGEKESQEDYIRSQLADNVQPNFFIQQNASTTIKRRIVDGYSFNKLFEIYVMDDSGLQPSEDEKLCKLLETTISQYDLVVVADFGHGTISKETRKLITERAPYLTVNTQANAGNRGFHTLSKYENFDYACIAGHELALEVRDQHDSNLRQNMAQTLLRLHGKSLVVTLGRNGSAACNASGAFLQVPSFAEKVVDRVGAGDTFLAVTSMASALGVSLEVLSFLGNVAGSLAVETIGNKKSINRQSIEKYITALMK